MARDASTTKRILKTARRSFRGAFAAALSVGFAASSVATLRAQEAKETPLPKSGTLSRTLSQESGSKSIPDPWGGTDLNEDSQPPITGSVSIQSRDKFVMRIFNNTEEDTYSVRVDVVQLDKSDRKVRVDPFSYTLGPKKSAERTVTRAASAADASLELRSWNKIGGKRAVESASAPNVVFSGEAETSDAQAVERDKLGIEEGDRVIAPKP